VILALCVVGGVLGLGFIGCCLQARNEKQAAWAALFVDAVKAHGERAVEVSTREPQPIDFWTPLVGSPALFVFTVNRHREELVFVASVTRVLPKGIVVTDLVEESIFLAYDALQYRPARPEDVQDDNMVITPPDIEEELDEEE